MHSVGFVRSAQVDTVRDPAHVTPPLTSGFRTMLLSRLHGARGAAAPGEVPAASTPLSLERAGEALSSAWRSLHGEDPPEKLVAVLVGQVSVETGGGRGMLNYNFGGIKGSGPSGLSYQSRTTEGYGPTEHKIRARFRAYRSAEEGATDYLRLLQSRFGSALEKAKEGDAPGYVGELKKAGYFTGSELAYTRAVGSVASAFSPGDVSPVGASNSGPTASPTGQQTRPQAATPARAHGDLSRESADELAWLSAMISMNAADEIARAAMRIASTSADSRADAIGGVPGGS